MSRILITGSAQGLGRNAATTLLDDGPPGRRPRPQPPAGRRPVRSHRPRGGRGRRRPRRPRADPVRGRSGQPARPDGRGHPQCRRLRRHRPPSQPGRASAGADRQHPRPLPADRADPATGPADLPDQRHARQRRRQPPRPHLEQPALGRHPGLLRQQAVRHRPRPRRCPPLARRDQPRRRPRLGADPDGRPRAPATTSTRATSPRPGSPPATTPKPCGPARCGNTADPPRSRPPPRTPPSRTDSSTSWPTSPATSRDHGTASSTYPQATAGLRGTRRRSLARHPNREDMNSSALAMKSSEMGNMAVDLLLV